MFRPTWIEHWLKTAGLKTEMSTCASGRVVGAVAVKDKREVASGYNGVPSGFPHPESCVRRELGIASGKEPHLCGCVHAEANLVANAARQILEGATVYVTTQPCRACMGLLVNAGVREVIYQGDYPDTWTEQIALFGGVKLIRGENNGTELPLDRSGNQDPSRG